MALFQVWIHSVIWRLTAGEIQFRLIFFLNLFFPSFHPSLMSEWVSEVTQSCLTLCDPTDCSLPGSSLHGILQARVLEWVAISFSKPGTYCFIFSPFRLLCKILREQSNISYWKYNYKSICFSKAYLYSKSHLYRNLKMMSQVFEN